MLCVIFFFFFSSRRRHTRCGRDWSSDVCSSDLDEPAVAILSRCAQAARPDGRVLVVERVVTSHGDQQELTDMDLRMLLLFGSRERSLEEFNALAAAAGMRLVSTRATAL